MLTFIRYIEVNFTFALVDCARYNEDFVKSRFVKSRFCSIHFIVILPGLKKIVRYTEDFVYKGSLNPGSTVIQVSKIQPVVYYQCYVLIG